MIVLPLPRRAEWEQQNSEIQEDLPNSSVRVSHSLDACFLGLAKCLNRPEQSLIVQAPNPILNAKSTKHPPVIRPKMCTTTPVASGSRTISLPLTRVSTLPLRCHFRSPESLSRSQAAAASDFDSACAGICSKQVSADDLFKINRQRNRKKLHLNLNLQVLQWPRRSRLLHHPTHLLSTARTCLPLLLNQNHDSKQNKQEHSYLYHQDTRSES